MTNTNNCVAWKHGPIVTTELSRAQLCKLGKKGGENVGNPQSILARHLTMSHIFGIGFFNANENKEG